MCCTFCVNPVLLLAPLSCAGVGDGLEGEQKLIGSVLIFDRMIPLIRG